MTFTPSSNLKPLLALAVLALGLSGAVYAQPDDDCGPIQGTIQVAHDDAPGVADLARVTPDQAREAALGAVPGAQVTDVDLEEEDGFLVYEVDLLHDGRETDVYVDAGSGEVLCVDRED
jgi:hypothetical protein